jgi:hypothetical protein
VGAVKLRLLSANSPVDYNMSSNRTYDFMASGDMKVLRGIVREARHALEAPKRLPMQRRQELADFYAEHDAQKAAHAASLVADFTTPELARRLRAKYGAVPVGWDLVQPPPRTDGIAAMRRDELAAFYKRRDPAKVANVEALLSEYNVPALARKMQYKYGKAPPGWVTWESGVCCCFRSKAPDEMAV